MFINEILDNVHKGKREKARLEAARKCAAVLGITAAISTGFLALFLFTTKSGKEAQIKMMNSACDTAEVIKKTVVQTAEKAKDSMSRAEMKASNVIADIHGKMETIKVDLDDGSEKVAQTIHETADHVSKDLKTEL